MSLSASWYVRKAGVLYGMGLRRLVLVVPVGPFAAVAVVLVLLSWDQFADSVAHHPLGRESIR